MQVPKQVTLCEVGPRDGLQNERILLSVEDKVRLIDACSQAGFPVIEVGSFVHPKAVPQMATTDEVFARIQKKEGVEYRAFVANLKGVERAAQCGCTKVKLNVSASTAHNLANLNCTPEETVAKFAGCVEKARENGMGVSGSISMAFGSPWDREIPLDTLQRITQAYLEVGVTELSLSDASGMGIPNQVFRICTAMQEAYPEVTWWLHLHNTRGLGLANIVAGMEAGITRFDSAFAGCGGCPFVPGAAGNVSSEDLLHMLEEMGIETGVDLHAAIEIGRLAEKLLYRTADSYVLKAGTNRELIRELPARQHNS